MKSLRLAPIGLVMLALVAGGCGPAEFTITKKPSYADLVVTYNAQVQTLDNLEGKRTALIAEYYSQAQEKAIMAAVDSLGSGVQQKSSGRPDDALDKAVAAAELQAQLQSGLLENVGQSSRSGSTTSSEYPEELKRKLADLDAEIAEQKERVERARQARDAAESK